MQEPKAEPEGTGRPDQKIGHKEGARDTIQGGGARRNGRYRGVEGGWKRSKTWAPTSRESGRVGKKTKKKEGRWGGTGKGGTLGSGWGPLLASPSTAEKKKENQIETRWETKLERVVSFQDHK